MSVLHVYTIYKTYGIEIFGENIDLLYGMATDFAELIKNNSNFELAYEPQCNIVCFRFTNAKGDLTSFNRNIRQLLLEDGRFYIVQTVLNGDLYLRVSLMNPTSTINELKELLQEIETKAALVEV